MELGNDNAFGTVDDESSFFGHVRNRAEIYILYDGGEILVVRVSAVKLELSLEGHTVCQSAFQTFFNGVARGVDVVVKKFQHEVVARVGYGEVLGKNLVKAFIVTLFRRSVQLEEVTE